MKSVEFAHPSGVAAVTLSIWRGIRFVAILAGASAKLLALRLVGRMRTSTERAAWLQQISRRVMKLLQIESDIRGSWVPGGVLVANHLSYLDIIVLAAHQPLVFVAKSEVRRWPAIGWIAAQAGTIFIDRTRRGDVARVTCEIERLVSEGVRVCIFPEGTSSDGSEVLPFHTSLLEPISARGFKVTAGWIGYLLPGGDPGQEVCYWGEMTFGSHFPRLLSKKGISVKVATNVVDCADKDRKQLGRLLWQRVVDLGKLAQGW